MKFLGILTVAAIGLFTFAADIELPAPQKTGGVPLMEALANRQTARAFADKPIPKQVLSNLLWAASGVNREDGKMTAPTARNRQELTLYVCIAEGTFRYDAKGNKLVQTSVERTGDAPLMVVITTDLDKQTLDYSRVDAGFVGQNIYLFCASEKLSTVFRGQFKAEDYNPLLKLAGNKRVIFVQAVGYPK